MVFNVIDILLLVLVLLSVLGGYRRGFILGVLDLAGWVLSSACGSALLSSCRALARRWCSIVAADLGSTDCLHSNRRLSRAWRFNLVGNVILRRLPKEIHHRLPNRLLGIIPGFAKWIDYCGNRLGAAPGNPAK